MTKLCFSFLLFFLVACASGHKKTSTRLRQLVYANQYEEAITFLKESPLAQDKKSVLLFHIELGLLQHYKADYQASAHSLAEAKKIIDNLYTTKASGKIASAISNDNADYYYSEKYEASLVYFYQGLNHFLLGDLEKARAEVLAWDSFITEMKNNRTGKAHFKDDLLAKTFGAFIHESQNNTRDDQVALQLYKDAADVFYKNYNLYSTFNKSFKEFRDHFSILHTLSKEEVEGKYVLATKHSSHFQNFLTYKVLELTKKIRPTEFKALVAKLGPSKEILDKLDTSTGKLTFLIQDGLIVEKEAKKYQFPMVWGGIANTIQFELPVVNSLPQLELSKLKALNEKGELVSEVPLTVIAPLDDIAEQAINEHSASIAGKTAARVTAKHVAALVASQASMRAGRSRRDAAGTMAFLFGAIGQVAASAAINESEKADVRFWSTLPSNIRMGQLALPNGSYRIQAVFGEEGSPYYKVIELGTKTVTKGSTKLVASFSHQALASQISSTSHIQISSDPSADAERDLASSRKGK